MGDSGCWPIRYGQSLSAAIVFRYIRFWPKKHRVLPFLALALFFICRSPESKRAKTVSHVHVPLSRSTLVPPSGYHPGSTGRSKRTDAVDIFFDLENNSRRDSPQDVDLIVRTTCKPRCALCRLLLMNARLQSSALAIRPCHRWDDYTWLSTHRDVEINTVLLV